MTADDWAIRFAMSPAVKYNFETLPPTEADNIDCGLRCISQTGT